MGRRLFYCFIALVCLLGALLVLSALLETPASAEPEPAEPSAANSVTAFAGMPPAPTNESAQPAAEWLRVAALFAAVTVLLPLILCICDANGRVLRKRSYVRSVHHVFKQEIACG